MIKNESFLRLLHIYGHKTLSSAFDLPAPTEENARPSALLPWLSTLPLQLLPCFPCRHCCPLPLGTSLSTLPQIQQSWNDHNCVKMLTEIPLFYGRKDKDSITARLIVDRVKKATQIATWADDRKVAKLLMILGDRALIWFESFQDCGQDLAVWSNIRNQFLKKWAQVLGSHHLHQLCCPGAEDQQIHGGLSSQGTVWLQEAVQQQTRSHLGHCWPRPSWCNERRPVWHGQALNAPAILGRTLQEPQGEGPQGQEEHLLRKTVSGQWTWMHPAGSLSEPKDCCRQSQDGPDEANSIAWETYIQEEIEQVTAICARNNCFLRMKKFGEQAYNNGPARSSGPKNPNVVCCYCQKKGYMQKECHLCLRDNARMVDANCKWWARQLGFQAQAVWGHTFWGHCQPQPVCTII